MKQDHGRNVGGKRQEERERTTPKMLLQKFYNPLYGLSPRASQIACFDSLIRGIHKGNSQSATSIGAPAQSPACSCQLAASLEITQAIGSEPRPRFRLQLVVWAGWAGGGDAGGDPDMLPRWRLLGEGGRGGQGARGPGGEGLREPGGEGDMWLVMLGYFGIGFTERVVDCR